MFYRAAIALGESTSGGSMDMQHDVRLRAAARVIYDACYPSEEWTPVCFDEAERHRTVHYRQAVDAALQARSTFGMAAAQLELI